MIGLRLCRCCYCCCCLFYLVCFFSCSIVLAVVLVRALLCSRCALSDFWIFCVTHRNIRSQPDFPPIWHSQTIAKIKIATRCSKDAVLKVQTHTHSQTNIHAPQALNDVLAGLNARWHDVNKHSFQACEKCRWNGASNATRSPVRGYKSIINASSFGET